MQTDGKSKKQVSVRILLWVLTAVSCYLAGHVNGYRIRRSEANSRVFVAVFPVPLSGGIATDVATASKTLADVTERIKLAVMPAVWSAEDSMCDIQTFATNQSLVVTGDQAVHEGVSAFLSQAKDVRLAR